MIKEALEYLFAQSLSSKEITPEVHYGRLYAQSINGYEELKSLRYSSNFEVQNLKSLKKMIDINSIVDYCVRILSHNQVVLSHKHFNVQNQSNHIHMTATFNSPFEISKNDLTNLKQKDMIIRLMTCFDANDDLKELIKVVSLVSQESGVKTEDDGVSQSVVTNSGIALKSRDTIKTFYQLRPRLTFPECVQPEVDFFIRVKQGHSEPLFSLYYQNLSSAYHDARCYIASYLESVLEIDDSLILV